ncbi:MAG TPA: hypothetical protein VJH67_02755 [Candidatus Paceibacterota bacterium]
MSILNWAKGVIKNHWFVIIPALIVGLLIVLPSVVSIMRLGDDFSGIYPMFSGDESFYLGITKEVYEGNGSSGNAFIKEHKGDLPIQSLLFENLPAWEAKILGLSVPAAAVLNDFLLPFFGVIMLYALFFSLTKNKILSNSSSFLFYFIFLSSFNRPINPQFSFVFFALAVFLVWKIISQRHELKVLVWLNLLLGLVFSLLVYTYPFYWTTILVLYLVSLFMMALKEKEWVYWIKNCGIFALISVISLFPYLLNILKVANNPHFNAATLRTGLVLTHYPGTFLNVTLILFTLFILFIFRSDIKEKRELLFCYALISTGVITNWQNVITGRVLQFSSHYYPIIIFLTFLILAIILKYNYKKLAASLLISAFLLAIIYKQRDDFLLAFRHIINPVDIAKEQKLAPVFAWINENTQTEAVIYALGENIAELVPIYTRGNNYSNGYASMYLLSDEEMENRWIIQNYWSDIDAEYVKKYNNIVLGNKFLDPYGSKESRRKILELITGRKYPANTLMPEADIKRIMDKFLKFKNIGFEKTLKTYQVDYVILGKSFGKDLDKYAFLVRAFENSEFIIFKVE